MLKFTTQPIKETSPEPQFLLSTDFGTWKRRKTKKLVSSELTSLTSSFAATEMSSQLQEVFKFMNTNGDGKISPLELMKQSCEWRFWTWVLRGDSIMEVFRVYDDDKNGLISARELQRVLGRLGLGKCRIRECRKDDPPDSSQLSSLV
ncbi:probable calcium-binding protein CML27 [Primulina eburnea]|uniref:probable calcium-binding protein CML27 n=1 Tax=Primulina eburnea TaxID=1245227 RepID=UPI003C6C938F